MDFDSYSSRLADLNKFSKEFFKRIKENPIKKISNYLQVNANESCY